MSSDHDRIPAVILAGGLGTRLKSVVKDCPKPMALVNGKPFLEYVLQGLEHSGIVSKCILSIGFMGELIESYFGYRFKTLAIEYSCEDSPLGTGGAVAKAIRSVFDSRFLLLNGDTLFPVDLYNLFAVHQEENADISIALKEMKNFERYGTVVCDGRNVLRFEEKKRLSQGLINGGVYIFNRECMINTDLPDVFSLERDFLEKKVGTLKVVGEVFNEYFIDIGVPEDFIRAQSEL